MSYAMTADVELINFDPRPEVEEVLQNVRTILATQAGTVPLDRDLGISWSFLDARMNQGRARINAEVTRKIQRYEPRARVVRVTYSDPTTDGTVKPTVHIEVTL